MTKVTTLESANIGDEFAVELHNETQVGVLTRITPKQCTISISGRDCLFWKETARYIKHKNFYGQLYLHVLDQAMEDRIERGKAMSTAGILFHRMKIKDWSTEDLKVFIDIAKKYDKRE